MDDFLENILAFSMVKKVKLRDRRLGILQLVGYLAVVAYFFIIVMFRDRRYLELYDVRGSLDYKLHPPSSYGVHEQMPYCKVYNGTSPAPVQLPCRDYSFLHVSEGSDSEVMFLASHTEDSTGEVFVAGFDEFVLGLSVAAHIGDDSSDEYKYGFEFDTFLRQHDDELIEVGSGYHSAQRHEFTLKEIVEASGARLEDWTSDPTNKVDHTLRQDGLNIHMDIHFDHDWLGDLTRIVYRFRATPLEARKYFRSPKNPNEAIQKRGLMIYISFSGTEGHVSLYAFTTAWVSSMALLGGVHMFWLLLMKVMPLHNLYKAYFNEQSVDFDKFKSGDHNAVVGMNAFLTQTGKHMGKAQVKRFCHHESGSHWTHGVEYQTIGKTMERQESPRSAWLESPPPPETQEK